MDFSFLQDALGNIPMVKNYMVISMIFSLPDSTSSTDVERSIRSGLDTLSDSFPHLKGHVIHNDKSSKDGRDDIGRVRIYPLNEANKDHISLTIKDLRKESNFPSLETLRKAKFPLSMLDGKMLVPYHLIPPFFELLYQDSPDRPARVLFFQENFINGGLILTIAANHTTMDMNGLGSVIELFAQACRGEAYTEQQLREVNQSRRDAVPLLGDDYTPGPEGEWFIMKTQNSWTELANKTKDGSEEEKEGQTSPAVCRMFTFSPASLVKLKAEASVQTTAPFISTNDAVTALLWQTISKVRAERYKNTTSPNSNTTANSDSCTDFRTTIARQVDSRRHFNLSRLYGGHMATSVFSTSPNVWRLPLGEVSAQLRLALSDPDVPFHLRAIATLVHRPQYRPRIAYAANLNFDRDVVISSWADVKCCETSFGSVLGVPEVAMRPRVAPFAAGAFIMPFTREGDLPVCVGLREDDMKRLSGDEELLRFAEYIG
ncbi:hypothetical protein PV10_04456 [Exophiala mesophila]|uniref:Trichothecene 3-O-acetyltransferase-like N-terminal domain-containing protein n=1 Tax=Exophiala mesophila TaxID=212818 RepID=A0A0D1ZER2_EXOME|nr:uncharacterized protein PV10_04456 [Exophiala mesophila]KIV93222.1 hypothetical protein PV10_04456 [Exophiala mesophila]